MSRIEDYLQKHIAVHCKDGVVVTGYAFDVEDESEDEEATDDSLVLDLPDGRVMSIYLSEIDHIEELKRKQK